MMRWKWPTNTRSTTWVIFDPRGLVEGPTPLHNHRRTKRSRDFYSFMGLYNSPKFHALAHLEVWKIDLLYVKSRGTVKSSTSSVNLKLSSEVREA